MPQKEAIKWLSWKNAFLRWQRPLLRQRDQKCLRSIEDIYSLYFGHRVCLDDEKYNKLMPAQYPALLNRLHDSSEPLTEALQIDLLYPKAWEAWKR